ncbi:MAG: hypothetical protein WD671_05965 [Parvibaculum sp.]
MSVQKTGGKLMHEVFLYQADILDHGFAPLPVIRIVFRTLVRCIVEPINPVFFIPHRDDRAGRAPPPHDLRPLFRNLSRSVFDRLSRSGSPSKNLDRYPHPGHFVAALYCRAAGRFPMTIINRSDNGFRPMLLDERMKDAQF